MEYVKRPIRAATTPAAQRFYLSTFLFIIGSIVLLFLATGAYSVSYYYYVPKKVVSIPVHLQYNAGLNPFGVSSLQKDLMLETAYDVTVTLTLPRSRPNIDRGNFMIALFATRSLLENPAQSFGLVEDPYRDISASNVVFSSRRPALIPYTDPVVSLASRVMFLAWHVFAPASEKVTLEVPMGELVEFREQLPLSLLLDVQAGQTFQVYAAQIELVARLEGVRWLMYNHRVFSFVAGTILFWISEMAWFGFAWLALAFCLGWLTKTENVPAIEEHGYGGDPEDDRSVMKRVSEEESTVPESTKESEAGPRAVKSEEEKAYERFIKEESVERSLQSRRIGYGEDDEGEGTGSSYSRGKGVVKRRISGESSTS